MPNQLVDLPALQGYWYVVAESADVSSAPVAARLLGRDLVLWRSAGGTLAAAPDLAPEVVNPHQTPRVHEFLQRMSDRPAVRAALAMSRTGRPQEAFVPGAEPSRWG